MESAGNLISRRVVEVRSAIAHAAGRAGREPAAVRLMAVVKNRAPVEIEEAVAAGVDALGENRVQEAERHLRDLPPDARGGCPLHFIGRLQANKARKALATFDSIDSVDSPSLASRLSRVACEEGLSRAVLIEVNLGGEAQKGGVLPADLASLCDQLAALPGLELRGLQGVSPLFESPEESRPFFRLLRGLFERERGRHLRPERFVLLSMGMSHDFEVAVEEGATLVRVGTALFGPRRSP